MRAPRVTRTGCGPGGHPWSGSPADVASAPILCGMPESLSIVAGGTAAVVLLGVGVSALFAEPNEPRGAVAEPMVVTVPPVIDPAPASPPGSTGDAPASEVAGPTAVGPDEAAVPAAGTTPTALPPATPPVRGGDGGTGSLGRSGTVRQDGAARARDGGAGPAPEAPGVLDARAARGTSPGLDEDAAARVDAAGTTSRGGTARSAGPAAARAQGQGLAHAPGSLTAPGPARALRPGAPQATPAPAGTPALAPAPASEPTPAPAPAPAPALAPTPALAPPASAPGRAPAPTPAADPDPAPAPATGPRPVRAPADPLPGRPADRVGRPTDGRPTRDGPTQDRPARQPVPPRERGHDGAPETRPQPRTDPRGAGPGRDGLDAHRAHGGHAAPGGTW